MMKPLTQHIVLTKFDHNRLRGLLQVLRERSGVDPWNLDALELELHRAQVVPPERVPGDVITMNSLVTLHELASGDRVALKLVFPGTTHSDQECVPVLSPLGIALLGCRVGHVLEWPTESGIQRLSVESVKYQPEAAGDFYL